MENFEEIDDIFKEMREDAPEEMQNHVRTKTQLEIISKIHHVKTKKQ